MLQRGAKPPLADSRACRAGRHSPPRRRLIAGADAIATAEQKVAELQADIDLGRERFVSPDVMVA